MFAGVECGVDVFDGSYPYSACQRGSALIFNNSLTGTRGPTELNLTDPRYFPHLQQFVYYLLLSRHAVDLAVLVDGCVCYTCTHHSRAYIHHLLSTKEILGRVLLML